MQQENYAEKWMDAWWLPKVHPLQISIPQTSSGWLVAVGGISGKSPVPHSRSFIPKNFSCFPVPLSDQQKCVIFFLPYSSSLGLRTSKKG